MYNGTIGGYDDGTISSERANGTVHNGGKPDEDDDGALPSGSCVDDLSIVRVV